jgi:aminoglycoside phosphotransferase (APT) family kinase protein
MQTWQERLMARVRRQSGNGSLTNMALRWLGLLSGAIELAHRVLERHPRGAEDVATLCHGDLWAPHIYFAGSEFRGFVDYERLTFSSPALDLAQVILHFNGWSSRDEVISAYEQQYPFKAEDKAVLPVAAILDLAGEAYWSLGMLCDQESDQSDRAVLMTNLTTLLGSLELILEELDAPKAS